MIRFDTPCVKVSGAVEYFRAHMSVGDYLTQENQSEMTWFGSGAEKLGLSGRCQLDHFEKLCAGQHPVTGLSLLVRNKGTKRRVCYFAQLSPPKDVSVLHLVGGDERIARWWQEAVAETLHEIEALTATRLRTSGKNADRATLSMVAAVVTHDANRALDPQLHSHVCIMNLTFDSKEDRWKGVQPSGYFRHQGFLREVCYNKLAGQMRRAGYTLEPAARLGFAVKGFPPELRERFSKRRQEILRQAAIAGISDQDGLQAITSRSRAAKTNATVETLRVRWRSEAGDELAPLIALIESTRGASVPSPEATPLDAIRSAERHLFERRSVVDDRLLLREALIAARGQVSLDALRGALSFRENAGELLRMDEELASREGLEAEVEFTSWASASPKDLGALGEPNDLSSLSHDQQSAVRGILSSKSAVVILQGDAGTGKTRSLKEIVAGIESADGRVFGCAPSAGAADVLRHELTSDAATLQHLLVNRSLQDSLRGRVLLVDEAGLVSTSQMRDLCRLAATHHNRLLLVGDTKQHTAVEAGDALRALQEFGHVTTFALTEIRRQEDAAYRRAVAMLAQGNALGAFNQFNRLGAICECPEAELWAKAAEDFVRTTGAGQSCLAISPVWEEISNFTLAVRLQLRHAERLGSADRDVRIVDSLKWTREERRRLRNYQPGDVLTFYRDWEGFKKFRAFTVNRIDQHGLVVRDAHGRERRLDPRKATGYQVGTSREIPVAAGERLLVRANVKPAGLRNGDLVEVVRCNDDGSIQLKDGRTIPGWFREFTHGYATTSHSAQGKTVDRGIVLMGLAGIAAGNLKQAYVSNSRFRQTQAIYTSDKRAAREAMMRPSDRRLALEMTGGKPAAPKTWRQRWRERLAPLLTLRAA